MPSITKREVQDDGVCEVPSITKRELQDDGIWDVPSITKREPEDEQTTPVTLLCFSLILRNYRGCYIETT